MKKFREFINEGLIQSYGFSKISKHLQNIGINSDNIWESEGAPGLNRINIEFNSKNADKLKEVHHKMTTIFGWFLSSVGTDDLSEPYWEKDWIEDAVNDLDETARLLKWHVEEYDDENVSIFIYEPKFDREHTIKTDTLYHITNKDNVDKIEKQGLVTKSMSKKSIHPDRIYLALNKKAFDKTDLRDHVGHNVLFQIDNSKLNLKLHYDVNMEDSVYTTDNIPPKFLKRI